MLTIRLQRTGKKNQADFRIVLAEKQAPVAKKFVEILGSYNPRKKVLNVKSEERLKYWIAQHVEISPTVHNLLVSKNLLDAKKVKAFNTPRVKPEPAVAEAKPAEAAPADQPSTEIKAEAPSVETAAENKEEPKPTE